MSHPRPSFAGHELMTPAEVGRLFGVTAKTASRWADQGHLDSVKTLGGSRRFRAEQVHELYDAFLRESNGFADPPAEEEDE
ncbi:MAG: helix-turn-helix domain-containing protein [Janthinobacterium lividum]